jgi:hypothetical protein
MLDEYSNFPAPNKETRISSVYIKILNNPKYKNVSKTLIYNEVHNFIDEYLQDKIGSFTGWHVFGIADCINGICRKIDERIIKSQKIIADFIAKKIWNTEYQIGRIMFNIRISNSIDTTNNSINS